MRSGSLIVLDEIRHRDYHSIRFLCVMIFFVFTTLSIMQMNSAKELEDYVSAPAYVTDVSSRQQYRKSGVRTLYSFTVHWEYEGQEYQKKYTDSLDPHSGLDEVHIAPDNSDITLGSSEGSTQGAIMTLLFCAVAFVVWTILFIISKNKCYEVKENCYMGIGLCSLSSIMTGFFYHAISTDPRYHKSVSTMGALLAVSVIGLTVSIILLIIVKKIAARK